MNRIDVRLRSRPEIERLLEKVPRSSLYDLIHSLANLEPHLTIEEFRQRRRLTKDKVLKLINVDKILLPVHIVPGRGDYRIPLSTAHTYDRKTAVGAPS